MLLIGDPGKEDIVSVSTVHADLIPTQKLLSVLLFIFIDQGDRS